MAALASSGLLKTRHGRSYSGFDQQWGGKRRVWTRREAAQSTAMTPLELIVRAGACTAALILAVTLFRVRHARLATRAFGATLCLGVGAYLACSGATPVCAAPWFQPFLL